MASTTELPTRVLAGVTIPDTPLITKAIEFARAESNDCTYNHVLRSLLLGFIIADKVLPSRDREAHAVAALLHDLGFPIGHPEGSVIISPDKRFEVDGAHAAREFLKREGVAGEWDKHRLQLVWDSIALHTIGSIVFHKEPEVQACSYGIWADFQGPDRVQGPPGLLGWDEYNAVVKEFPRLGLMKDLKEQMCHLCRTKPQTTLDSTVGEWGDKYVEGYDRKGKLTQDLLETCNLDEIEPK